MDHVCLNALGARKGCGTTSQPLTQSDTIQEVVVAKYWGIHRNSSSSQSYSNAGLKREYFGVLRWHLRKSPKPVQLHNFIWTEHDLSHMFLVLSISSAWVLFEYWFRWPLAVIGTCGALFQTTNLLPTTFKDFLYPSSLYVYMPLHHTLYPSPPPSFFPLPSSSFFPFSWFPRVVFFQGERIKFLWCPEITNTWKH